MKQPHPVHGGTLGSNLPFSGALLSDNTNFSYCAATVRYRFNAGIVHVVVEVEIFAATSIKTALMWMLQ